MKRKIVLLLCVIFICLCFFGCDDEFGCKAISCFWEFYIPKNTGIVYTTWLQGEFPLILEENKYTEFDIYRCSSGTDMKSRRNFKYGKKFRIEYPNGESEEILFDVFIPYLEDGMVETREYSFKSKVLNQDIKYTWSFVFMRSI